MRHIKMDTLYPFIELICPVCDEESDHPVSNSDPFQAWNSLFQEPICHCGHRFGKIETEQRGTLYG